MRGKIKTYLESLRSENILSVLFLLFIFYVGFATLPIILKDIGTKLDNGISTSSLNNLMKSIDKRYFNMLSTETDRSSIQNKGTYINLNGAMANLMGQRYLNERLKLNNGH